MRPSQVNAFMHIKQQHLLKDYVFSPRHSPGPVQTQGRSPALNPAVDAQLAAKGLSPGADSCTQKFFLYYSSEIFPNSGFFPKFPETGLC